MRRSRNGTKILLAAIVASTISIAVACQGDGGAVREAIGSVAVGDSAPRRADTAVSGGEVAVDSSAGSGVVGRWLSDENVLALLGVIANKEIAAADVELQAWRSDTVRALAASIAHDYAQLQHSADSAAARAKMSPVMPALAESLSARLQASIDSLSAYRGGALDRAYVNQQIGMQQYVTGVLTGLSGVAERPEVQGVLAAASLQSASALARVKAVQTGFVVADSLAAADSAAKRAAKRKRQPIGR